MRHCKLNSIVFALVCGISAASFIPLQAHAQSINVKKNKKKNDKGAEEATNDSLKRMKDRTSILNVDKTKQKVDIADGPSADLKKFEDSENKLTPEQIEEIKRQLEQKNRAMIAKLDKVIAGAPTSPAMPEWLFQKAELLWELRNKEYMRERAKYNQCIDASLKGNIDANTCVEPVPDYSDAQEIYKEILASYPDYNRLDEVIYRLGRGLLDADKGVEAVKYLQRLVKDYPNSKYLPEAHVALGEYFFDKEILGLARDNYKVLLEDRYKTNKLRDYARYKLAWVYYNQQEFPDAVQTFKDVIESTEDKVGFQRQALNDLVVAYAEIPNGWEQLRDYLTKQIGEEGMYDKLGKLAALYEMQGKNDEAVQVYEYFIDKKPNDPKLPSWAESIILAKKADVNDHDSLEKQMNRFIDYFSPKGAWYAANKDNKEAINNATLLVDASLAYLANYFHVQAQELDNKKNQALAKESYQKAAKYYQEYIDRFPDSVAAFDANYMLGQIYLTSLNEYEKAAQQFQKVIDLYKENKIPEGAKKEDVDRFVHDAAFNEVAAYDELVKENHKDSILVKMAEYNEREAAKKAKERQANPEDKPNPETPLLKYEEGFVKASDQFSDMYPKDEETPTIDFIAAEVYKARGHYDRAIPRYESIIRNAPKHRYASFAGNSLLEANYRLKRWDEVEKWARHLIKNKIFDVTPKDKLEESVIYAVNESARQLAEAGNADKAVERWLSLVQEFPKTEYAPAALFNAGAAYEGNNKIGKAIDLYERVITDYPKSDFAPKSIIVMGDIYQARANFDKAASYYERIKSDAKYKDDKGDTHTYHDYPGATDAVHNAAVIREAMQNWDNALDDYNYYVKTYPNDKYVREVTFKIPEVLKEKKDYQGALDAYEKLLKRKDITPVEQVDIYTEIGLLQSEIKDKDWENVSDKSFSKAVAIYKKLPEDQKQAAAYSASEARFTQAERIYDKFKDIVLTFPIPKFRRLALQKGELEQQAEKIYLEIVQMKSPLWLAASAYRIGDMYKEFSDQLYAIPLPKGLTEDQEFEYRNAVDEKAFPLQEKALTGFRTALQLAIKYKAYNEWSRKSALAISKLETEAYPISGEEGLTPDHFQVNFSKQQPLTDMNVVEERLAARKERLDKLKAEAEAKRKAELERIAKEKAAAAAAAKAAQSGAK